MHTPRLSSLPICILLRFGFNLSSISPTSIHAWQRRPSPRGSSCQTARCVSALHGDLHHENILDFGERGWLAIDPHGLRGERFFDFANIFTNPDLSDLSQPVGVLPGRLEARLKIVAEMAQVEPGRILRWIVAWTGLSAAWFIGDGDDKGTATGLTINDIACGILGL